MDPLIFDDLETTLKTRGPQEAIERLCSELRARKEYRGYFYALLLKKRFELGVSPLPTSPAQELPEAVHEPYEEAIRSAARLVGNLFLEEGDIPQAWIYFHMIGEPEPVARALEKAEPASDESVQPLVDIAYHQGVQPRKGFDLVLDRLGICSAITLVTGMEFPHGPDVREYCVQRLVRALHAELRERLKIDIARREGSSPGGESVPELFAGRDWLFEDELYHIDVSHLSAVVQMSVFLPRGPELALARELCAYGSRLAPRLRYAGDPPFEDQYVDYAVYLTALAGEREEEGLDHFRAKVERAAAEQGGTAPVEVLVNLLLRLNRADEALSVARRYLSDADSRMLSCPSVTDLCRKTGDYQTLTEVARRQGDPVHFLAGLLAAK